MQLAILHAGIPLLDGSEPAVVAEDAQRPGVEQELTADTDRKTEPSRDEHPQHMPMAEQRHVSVY